MAEYDNWVASGSSILVGGSGEAVAHTWDAPGDFAVHKAVADLIAREHNMIPRLLDSIRGKELAVKELYLHMRMVQKAHARQRENLQAEILMLKAAIHVIRPLFDAVTDNKVVIRPAEGTGGMLYFNLMVDAMVRLDMIELYYTPFQRLMEDDFHGYTTGERGEPGRDFVDLWHHLHEEWKTRAQELGRPSKPAFGSVGNLPEGPKAAQEAG